VPRRANLYFGGEPEKVFAIKKDQFLASFFEKAGLLLPTGSGWLRPCAFCMGRGLIASLAPIDAGDMRTFGGTRIQGVLVRCEGRGERGFGR